MFKMSQNYRSYKENGVAPIIYAFVISTRNVRVYSTIPPDDSEIGITQTRVCDGTIIAGDGTFLGALPITEYEPRIITFGSYRETLIPIKDDLLTSLTMTELGAFLITLDNSDAYFSTLLGENNDEIFLGTTCYIYQGFQGLGFSDFIKIIQGTIVEIQLSTTRFSLLTELV